MSWIWSWDRRSQSRDLEKGTEVIRATGGGIAAPATARSPSLTALFEEVFLDPESFPSDSMLEALQSKVGSRPHTHPSVLLSTCIALCVTGSSVC